MLVYSSFFLIWCYDQDIDLIYRADKIIIGCELTGRK